MQAVAIAGTLVFGICFQMALFCMTNHPDTDMRKHTYEVVSTTVSIFSAVLIFQTFNHIVEETLLEDASPGYSVLVDMTHMLVWFVLLQMTLYFIAVVYGRKTRLDLHPEAAKENTEIMLKCYAVILSHITGFASINAWGSLQHLAYFSSSKVMIGVAVLVAALGQLILQRLTDSVRYAVARIDDGEEDEFEELWDEETEEAENDVMGLTVSFLTTQALRCYISGVLPSPEGEETWSQMSQHNLTEDAGLFFCAIFFAACLVGIYANVPGDLSPLAKRFVDSVVGTASMAFAWCAFFSVKWFVAVSFPLETDMMLVSVLITVVVSVASFTAIFLLDKIADARPRVNISIRQIISGIGILVGFSWEQSFDEAMKTISSILPNPDVARAVLALFSILVIVPAWRWWILPMVHLEGWRFGFLFPDHTVWSTVLEDRKFEDMLHRIKHEKSGRPKSGPYGEQSTLLRMSTERLEGFLNVVSAKANRLLISPRISRNLSRESSRRGTLRSQGDACPAGGPLDAHLLAGHLEGQHRVPELPRALQPWERGHEPPDLPREHSGMESISELPVYESIDAASSPPVSPAHGGGRRRADDANSRLRGENAVLQAQLQDALVAKQRAEQAALELERLLQQQSQGIQTSLAKMGARCGA